MNKPDISERHHRRSIRYPQYDYSRPGFYFVTIAAYQHECIFGQIDHAEMQFNLAGQCARAVLLALSNHFPVQIDAWVIMPNHLHVIFHLLEKDTIPVEANPERRGRAGQPENMPFETDDESPGGFAPTRPHGTQPGSIGAVVQNYKSLTTRRINAARNSPDATVWQRNYFEHIVRDERELMQIRAYILDNPRKWEEDSEYGLGHGQGRTLKGEGGSAGSDPIT